MDATHTELCDGSLFAIGSIRREELELERRFWANVCFSAVELPSRVSGPVRVPAQNPWEQRSFWGAHYRLQRAIQHDGDRCTSSKQSNTARLKDRRRRCFAQGTMRVALERLRWSSAAPMHK